MTTSNATTPAGMPRTWLVPAVLMLASSVSILATDLYTPSLPHLTEVFSASAETVQLTMTLNLAGFAVGQLLYGPLSDRFGRRPMMLIGIASFIVLAAACALAWSIESLIVFRILLGLVAACEAVLGMAIIKEVYGEKDGVKIVAIYSMVIAAAPAVGPLIGGQMLVHFGWESNFWLLVGLAAIAWLAIARFLSETSIPNRAALRPSRLVAEARATLRVPAFWLYTIGPSAALGGLFAYITEGPFVLIAQLGVPADAFGYYHAAIVVVFFIANLGINRWSSRASPQLLLRLGSVAALMAGAVGLVVAGFGLTSPSTITAAVALFAVGMAFVYAVAPLQALAATTASTGMAASLRGFLEMSGAMLGSAGVAALHDGTEWPLVLILAACAVAIAIGDLGAARYARPLRPAPAPH